MKPAPGEDRTDVTAVTGSVRQDVGSEDVRTALSHAHTQAGDSLLELSNRQRLLLIFLRHFG